MVDAFHLMIGLVVLGGSTPVFDAPRPQRLTDARMTDGSSNVRARYAASTPVTLMLGHLPLQVRWSARAP
jgi:hypothetical protein